jgi:hypothetical protein
MNNKTDLLRKRLKQLLPLNPILDNSPDTEIAMNINSARAAFIMGYYEALELHPNSLKKVAEKVIPSKIGFALEGAAMAMVILDELDRTGSNYFQLLFRDSSEDQQIIYLIGAGMASAKLAKPIDWLPEGLDFSHLPAIYNGYGFYNSYFKSPSIVSNRLMLSFQKENIYFDRGCGRALWFTHMGNISAIVGVINGASDSRKAMLWNGVAVASAFTGNRFIEERLYKAAGLYERNVFEGLESATKLLKNLTYSQNSKNYG